MRSKTCLLIATLLIAGACDDSTTTEPGLTSAALDVNATWATPALVDAQGLVNTPALEGCPHESPDGLSLFFASDRAGTLDLWVSQRRADGTWGAPEPLPAPVNSTANDFCPTPQPDGSLLFVSTRTDLQNCGKADIYETHREANGAWSVPANLGCTVNSAGNEFSPAVTNAGGGLLFFSSDRSGKHELFMSTRGTDMSWGAPNAVTELNEAGYNTARPNISADGREIVFDSDRPGRGSFDIWTSQRANLMDAWSAPTNVTAINSSASETRATFSRDRRRLYFGSTRLGSSDIFVATR
jgi:hypothetical protein